MNYSFLKGRWALLIICAFFSAGAGFSRTASANNLRSEREPAEVVLPGDFNGDGNINIFDYFPMLQVIWSNSYAAEMDFNHDEVINIVDLQTLINGILGRPVITHTEGSHIKGHPTELWGMNLQAFQEDEPAQIKFGNSAWTSPVRSEGSHRLIVVIPEDAESGTITVMVNNQMTSFSGFDIIETRCPESVIAMADENGLFVVPEIQGFDPQSHIEWYEQSPDAGTVLDEIGEHNLALIGFDGNTEFECVTILRVVDVTGPRIQVTGAESGKLYSIDDVVAVTAVATDNSTEVVTVSMDLDGGEYVAGTPITEPGVHGLRIYATDGAGNTTEEALIFQITANPWETDAPVFLIGAQQIGDGARITVAVGSNDYQVQDLDLESMILWPMGEANTLLMADPIRLQIERDEEGFFPLENNAATLERGTWILNFEAEELDLSEVEKYYFFSSGFQNTTSEFDLDALIEADETFLLEDLIENGLFTTPTNDNPFLVPEEKVCNCKWKSRYLPNPKDETPYFSKNFTKSTSKSFGYKTYQAYAFGVFFASGTSVGDRATLGEVAASVSARGGGSWLIWGPNSACCTCSMTCKTSPQFRLNVSVKKPSLGKAQALAAGFYDFKSTNSCVQARLADVVQVGGDTGLDVSFDLIVKTKAKVGTGTPPSAGAEAEGVLKLKAVPKTNGETDSRTPGVTDLQEAPSCKMHVLFATGTKSDTIVDDGFLSSATATAISNNSRANVQVDATATCKPGLKIRCVEDGMKHFNLDTDHRDF